VSQCQKRTLWCKGRLTEADTLTIRLGATPSGVTSACLHHPHIFFKGQMPFLPPNQQCQALKATSAFGFGKDARVLNGITCTISVPYFIIEYYDKNHNLAIYAPESNTTVSDN